MKRYTNKQIKELAKIVINDGVISVPTDTVYGLCARYDHIKAQEKLREIKHRPETKAFPIMCKDLPQIESIATVDKKAKQIINALMPGPITIVLNKKEDVEDSINGGMKTLAIRMATSKELEELIEEVGVPIFMTSANESGKNPCKNLDEIEETCKGIEGLLEGDTQFGEASTIVDCSDREVKILRKGPITEEMIQKVLKEDIR